MSLVYFSGDLLMPQGRHTSSSKPLLRTLSVTLMTFFLEKSTFILQSAVQEPPRRSLLQSHPLSHITEPSQNPNPRSHPLKYRPQQTPHKHEPPRKPPQLRVCPALGHLPRPSLQRRIPWQTHPSPRLRPLLHRQLTYQVPLVGRSQRKQLLVTARRCH